MWRSALLVLVLFAGLCLSNPQANADQHELKLTATKRPSNKDKLEGAKSYTLHTNLRTDACGLSFQQIQNATRFPISYSKLQKKNFSEADLRISISGQVGRHEL